MKKDKISSKVNEMLEKTRLSEKEGSYIEMMCLSIGEENMLIPVSEVEEVVRVQPLTRVPMAPEHLLGVCNVHGQIACVIDPCVVMRLGCKSNHDTEETRFVILRHPSMNLALKVAVVSALFRVQEDLLLNLETNKKSFFRGELQVEGKSYQVIHTDVFFA